MSNALSEEEINHKLAELNGWVFENDCLKRSFEFSNFRDAMSFILRISYEAEAMDHHPEIFNCYNRVNLSLNTHDAGGKVTAKDFSLALAVDRLKS
ncbi:MAG: pterin-4-alpha-carbinolamine dehydratase 2 [SAR86 cluster bacterium SAR86B]|uniref:Putative pterin-4-alpha-carbinolamine dehydratase n=1 Tax=SAR86 cluster bacterium SAR86B TaxID=1123867 RepID=J4KTA8_9GAMM|nr:MAG: pterin-4-alpha-carbinolamine dehydratase 2 [SAR86 cluster bacterium SAR86B]